MEAKTLETNPLLGVLSQSKLKELACLKPHQWSFVEPGVLQAIGNAIHGLLSGLLEPPVPWFHALEHRHRGMPVSNVEERADAYVLRVDLPGVAPRDVRYEARAKRFTLAAERRATSQVYRGDYDFERAIDPAGICLDWNGDVLTITLRKAGLAA